MDPVPLRVYADTSVFGGVFDAEFQTASASFFEQVRQGRFWLVTSPLVTDELVGAPEEVRDFFEALPGPEVVDIDAASLALRAAYLAAEIVSQAHANDALHVALATVWRCPVLLSWNFKHIVHFGKMRRYNAVNTLHGYSKLGIFTPAQVIDYESEDV